MKAERLISFESREHKLVLEERIWEEQESFWRLVGRATTSKMAEFNVSRVGEDRLRMKFAPSGFFIMNCNMMWRKVKGIILLFQVNGYFAYANLFQFSVLVFRDIFARFAFR